MVNFNGVCQSEIITSTNKTYQKLLVLGIAKQKRKVYQKVPDLVRALLPNVFPLQFNFYGLDLGASVV